MLGYDDSLDVFGVHGVGGIVGALLHRRSFAAPALGGFGPGAETYAIGSQFMIQLTAVVVAVVWSGVVAAVSLYIVRALIGLRLPEAAEREGLDISSHGERAYN